MIDTNPTISIITSNVNGQLKVRDCQRGLKKKQKKKNKTQLLRCLQETHFKYKDTDDRLKLKG